MTELVCHCTGRSGFHPDPEMTDFEFWVCADCNQPTEMYLASVMERT